jgi:GT2 family glycosyltransferase
MPWSPTVTALIPAFEAERFVDAAVRSALAQDYPAELLDVVVVDDGCTDATAAIVQRLVDEHPGRVRLIRQENRGLVGAVNRAAEAADGELLALLDADDLWPADKIRRQVELLALRPEVGLVYTDMRVIDADGAVLDRSWLAGSRPPQDREVGRFLEHNSVTASSVVVRAALRDRLFPIPDEMPWADWWLGVRAAQVSRVAYMAEPKTLYRFHGANMSLGSQGAVRLRELRKALSVQRYFLRRLPTPETAIGDLEHAWDAFCVLATEALGVAGTPFLRLVDVSECERDDAAALARTARGLLARGELHAALGAAVRAAATDPGSDEARATLLEVRAGVPGGAGQQPLSGARDVVVSVPADEVLRDPDLLGGLVGAIGDRPDVTLAIDASTADAAEAARQLGDLARAHGLEDDDTLDVVVVTGPLDDLGRARLSRGTSARVGARSIGDDTPCFTADRLGDLRAWVLARAADRAAA